MLGFVFPSPEYRRQLLTGMLALSVLFFGLTGIAFESLSQRTSGVYKLLRATPYNTLTFITNLATARGVVALLSSTVVGSSRSTHLWYRLQLGECAPAHTRPGAGYTVLHLPRTDDQ